MKKRLLSAIIIGLIVFSFSCCTNQTKDMTGVTESTETNTTAVVTIETTETAEAEESTQKAAEKSSTGTNEHCSYYLEGYNQSRMIMYFYETALSSEFSTGKGDAKIIHKWDSVVYYRLNGDYTNEDEKTVEEMFSFLNSLNGFPKGIRVYDEKRANLNMYFLDREPFNEKMEKYLQSSTADGGVTYWYDNKSNAINKEMICILSSLEGDERKSVIMEEMYNGMGLSNDTQSRQDSIIYQYSNDNTSLSEVDKVIIKLLYNPNISSGMSYNQCKEIIKSIYY